MFKFKYVNFKSVNTLFRRVVICSTILLCAINSLSFGKNNLIVGEVPVAFEHVVKAGVADRPAKDHPALKPLDNPVPPVDKNDGNRSVSVGREIRLTENELYSPMNMFWDKAADSVDSTVGDWRFNTGAYRLLPTGKDSWGKDTFLAEQVIPYTASDSDRQKGYTPDVLFGAAMGVDTAENNEEVMYLTHGTNPYTVWKAIDGERNLYKVAEFKSPLFQREDGGLISQCYNSSTAMAPNGTLWFTTARDEPVGPNGKTVISMLDPQLDSEGEARLINSVKRRNPGDPNSKEESTIVDALDPSQSLEGKCIRGGVFDEDGYYYVRVGERNFNAADDILRFDLSDFPDKVPYTRIKFDIRKFGVGLAWHDDQWWSAPTQYRWYDTNWSHEDEDREDYEVKPGQKNLPEARQAFNVNPKTASKTLMDVPNFSGEYPLVPINTVISTERVPPLELDVRHIPRPADAVETLRGSVVDYTVTINNKENGGGLWYTGEAFVNLGDVMDFVEDVDPADSKAEVVGYDGTVLGSGEVLRSGARLVWKGTIPLGGQLIWRYSLKVKGSVSHNRILSTSVATSQGWRSNCPWEQADDQACQARVTVRDSDLRISKTDDSGNGEGLVSRGVIAYTVTATNQGSRAYEGDIVDDLRDVLKYASYNNDVSVSFGSAPVFDFPTLTWSGKIMPGESLTMRYSVQVFPKAVKTNSAESPP